MTNSYRNSTFNIREVDRVFELVTSVDNELKEDFDKYITEEYIDATPRLYYLDIAEISRFIVKKIKLKQTDFMKELFIKVEQILFDCDKEVENLIVVGLFEGIQNIGGSEIDYYHGFNVWLLPLSKTKWDNLIDFWEGSDWKERK